MATKELTKSPVVLESIATSEHSFEVRIADPEAAIQVGQGAHKIFDNVLGNVSVTRWQPTDFLRPPGLALKTTGGIDPAVAESVYEAVLRGDTATLSRALGNLSGAEAAGAGEGAESGDADADADAPSPPSKPEGMWKITDAYGLEPLAHAATSGHLEVANALLEAGADVAPTRGRTMAHAQAGDDPAHGR